MKCGTCIPGCHLTLMEVCSTILTSFLWSAVQSKTFAHLDCIIIVTLFPPSQIPLPLCARKRQVFSGALRCVIHSIPIVGGQSKLRVRCSVGSVPFWRVSQSKGWPVDLRTAPFSSNPKKQTLSKIYLLSFSDAIRA